MNKNQTGDKAFQQKHVLPFWKEDAVNNNLPLEWWLTAKSTQTFQAFRNATIVCTSEKSEHPFSLYALDNPETFERLQLRKTPQLQFFTQLEIQQEFIKTIWGSQFYHACKKIQTQQV